MPYLPKKPNLRNLYPTTNLGDILRQATDFLSSHDIDSSRLDSLILCEDILQHDRAWILAHTDIPFHAAYTQSDIINRFKSDKQALKVFTTWLEERATHKPLAYIRGIVDFYGQSFYVTPAVLIPRPETEDMVQLAGVLMGVHAPLTAHLPLSAEPTFMTKNPRVADIGTGSGAVGISTQIQSPLCTVDLLDIDKSALIVAKKNVASHTLRMSLHTSYLLDAAAHDYDMLLCNLPYVPDTYPVNISATFEPSIALYGGVDGLDLYRRLFSNLQNIQHHPLYVLTECLPEQQRNLSFIAASSGYQLLVTERLTQVYKSSVV